VSPAGRYDPAVRYGGLSLLFFGLVAAAPAWAERLPIKAYTTADGLAQNTVVRIVRDSRGFLWFCTRDGLSRFDGYAFTNYGMAHGLPHPNVNHLLEARDGAYWVATNGGGVARLAPKASGSLFTLYPVGDNPITNRVNVLYQDRAGSIWAGTDGEVFRLDGDAFRKVDLGLAPGHRWLTVLAFAEDGDGNLWFGTSDGLFVRRRDGRVRSCAIGPSQGYDWVRALLVDPQGRLWIGHHGRGVLALDLEKWRAAESVLPDHYRIEDVAGAVAARFAGKSGLGGNSIHSLYRSSDGRLWIGSEGGLGELEGSLLRNHGKDAGVAAAPLTGLTEDTGGNLWAATPQGALKIARSGITTFDTADGLSGAGVRSIGEDAAGTLYVTTYDARIHSFDGRAFRPHRSPLPASVALHWPQTALRDRAGDWWVATREGLYRFAPDAARPKAVYTTRDGLSGDGIFSLYESTRGDIWISMADVENAVMQWERASGAFRVYTQTDGVPDFVAPSCFAEDRAGGLWAGVHDGGLLRYRDGRFRHLTAADGVPAGQITHLHTDGAGRLWIATNASGVGRIDDPAAESPRVSAVTIKDGLASNNVTCLAEDREGRLYLGSGRGVDRLDPATGRVTHYGEADGLDVGGVEAAHRDREGRLWFGGPRGVSRLLPGPDRAHRPPPVHISGLHVPGLPTPLSELGEPEVAGLELGPDQNQIVIEYVGLAFTPGETLRYRYMLVGADTGWSAPTAERAVHYAQLAPGRYRFQVLAESAAGGVSSRPAVVAFTVLPRLWQRGWFVALCALAAGLAGTALYRYRVARLLEVANVRTRIATDLHDDIGANLTKIAILSEVARQQLGPGAEGDGGPLGAIARISRESVASMSDIVWAVDPRRDGLPDLVRRMRLHAEELFAPRGIALGFDAPAEGRLRLGAGVRRDVFLVFKEALNNAARHSGCTRVEVGLRLEGGGLCLRVADDGSGFDASAESDGQGLASMRRRAQRLGAALEVASAPGKGTEVVLRVPHVDT
jgi:ligand-binding sensor domain-containing protein/signal transduction histidine kinase